MNCEVAKTPQGLKFGRTTVARAAPPAARGARAMRGKRNRRGKEARGDDHR